MLFHGAGTGNPSLIWRRGPEAFPAMVEGLDGERPDTLTSQGELRVWGCGKNCRLELGGTDDEAEPTLVESLNGL